MLAILNSRRGFTLFELLIYIAIFVIFIVSFVAILINVLRVQNRQESTTEVNTSIQFAMQRIQTEISAVSSICLNSSTEIELSSCAGSGNIIKLDMGSIKVGNNSITGGKVQVDKLNFTKIDVPTPERPLINIEIQMSFKDGLTNPQKAFTQVLRSSARPLK